MSLHESPEELAEERRQEIFLAIAEAEDLHEFTPEQARRLLARRFGISETQIKEIEREGRERLWASS
jgi:hypothetical protein